MQMITRLLTLPKRWAKWLMMIGYTVLGDASDSEGTGMYIFLVPSPPNGREVSKEDIIYSVNGCDELVWVMQNVEDLNGAKWMYAIKNSLVCRRWHTWEELEPEGARRSWIWPSSPKQWHKWLQTMQEWRTSSEHTRWTRRPSRNSEAASLSSVKVWTTSITSSRWLPSCRWKAIPCRECWQARVLESLNVWTSYWGPPVLPIAGGQAGMAPGPPPASALPWTVYNLYAATGMKSMVAYSVFHPIKLFHNDVACPLGKLSASDCKQSFKGCGSWSRPDRPNLNQPHFLVGFFDIP